MNNYLNSEELYDKIDKMREEKHWSIYELAKRAGVTENAIYKWRDKKSTPSVYLLTSICSAFNIPFVSLFMNKEKDLIVLTEEQKILINAWSYLNKEQREAIMKIINLHVKYKAS